MFHRPQDYRDKVAAEYEKAITPDGKESMVQGTGGGKFADYGEEDLRALPAEAIDASFGCGNPIAFAGVRLGETVLDLGSGAGLDLMLAAERVGSSGKVIGVDMTDAMIERALATIASAGYPNVEVRKGLIEELPIDSNSVDWVISNCVINLAADKAKVFAEVARVLKPGGRMLVSDIVAHDLPWWVRRSGLLTIACAGGAISEDATLMACEMRALKTFRLSLVSTTSPCRWRASSLTLCQRLSAISAVVAFPLQRLHLLRSRGPSPLGFTVRRCMPRNLSIISHLCGVFA